MSWTIATKPLIVNGPRLNQNFILGSSHAHTRHHTEPLSSILPVMLGSDSFMHNRPITQYSQRGSKPKTALDSTLEGWEPKRGKTDVGTLCIQVIKHTSLRWDVSGCSAVIRAVKCYCGQASSECVLEMPFTFHLVETFEGGYGTSLGTTLDEITRLDVHNANANRGKLHITVRSSPQNSQYH